MSISARRLRVLVAKEWSILSRDVNVVVLASVVPLLIIAEAIVVIWLVERFAGSSIAASAFFATPLQRLSAAIPEASTLSLADQVRLFLLSQLGFYLLLIPVMIAVSVATFSIVEEKLSGSLEALLATPVRTEEILLAKALAGAVPALLVTWACGGLTLFAITLLGWGHLVSLVVSPAWLLSLLLLVPLTALLAFMLGVIGSSRARDAKSAQNIVLLVIFPLFGLIASQITGLLWFGVREMSVLAGVVALVDYLTLRAAVRLFKRESIIVGWR